VAEGEGEAAVHDIPGGARVASTKLVDRRARTALAADTLDHVKSASSPPKTSKEIYRSVAPATVIVRVADGLGSGVVVDPAGYVLTNHHVIAAGRKQDFRITVSVMLGALASATGAMSRQEKVYDAHVYKADKLRDIALLKIVDPPKKLSAVKLARNKPVPGDQVISLGHAGAGMLWAIKAGEISALGKLSEHLATLASFKDDDDGRKAREAFQKSVEDRNLGMVIQSTCNILPGDSGGPLVNRAGELVGLNAFSSKDQRTGGLISFHVHLAEIRKFLADRPKIPARLLPDPWAEGGGDLSYEDADLDGRVDILLMQGRRPCGFCPRQSVAAFLDVDQSSFAGNKKLPELSEVFDDRKFDAEVVYLQVEKDAFVWYDTDDDGKYDHLLYDENTTGLTSAGYEIGADGDLRKSRALSTGKVFRPALFRDAGLRDRFVRIARGAFPGRYTDSTAPFSTTLPEPIGSNGKAETKDLNGDGRDDAVELSTAFSQRLLIDADQSSVPQLRGRLDVTQQSERQALDAEIAAVSQSTHMWVWYDTDDDRRFDLVLHAPETRLYVAADAWKVDEQGKRQPAIEHVGRKLVRPDLLSTEEMTRAVRSMVSGRGLLAIMSAKDAGVGSFPDPVADHRGYGAELLELPAAPRAVVTLIGQGSDGYLIDLDQSSLLGRAPSRVDLAQFVGDGKLDAEFAYFQRNGVAWAYYDSDNRGGYDVVLVCRDLKLGQVTVGFRIDSSGRAVVDPTLAGKPLVQHSLVQNPLLRSRFKKLTADLFSGSMLEG
jgi:S1-C subfamily serine protease